MGPDVDPDVLGGELVLVAEVAAGAAQQRADAREELRQAERLGHVVVGTGVETDDEVHLVRAGREHEHGRGEPLVADPPGDVESVHVRQAEVQDEEIGRERAVDGALPGAVDVHLVALAPERSGQRLGDRGVVFREKDSGHAPHAIPIDSSRRRSGFVW